MTKFNKSLLTAAVVGALALPSIASAATLGYTANKQITFAKDLIVNNGTTINTPNGLHLTAEGTDSTRITTVAANSNVTVKVTLTNGAKFDSTADAQTLVEGFKIGQQLGATGAGGVLISEAKVVTAGYTDNTDPANPVVVPPVLGSALVGAPYYSASGQELNFTFTVPGAGNAGTGFALELNSKQITNLVQGLFEGSSIGAEITMQNASGQQILAASKEIAKSDKGLKIEGNLAGAQDLYIEASAGGSGSNTYAGKTRFSTTRAPGGVISETMNVGAVSIDVNRVAGTAGGAEIAVNNFSAVATSPQYNVVGTAEFKIAVNGANLSAFNSPGSIFLSSTASCTGGTTVAGAVSADFGTANWTLPASSALLVNVTNPQPTASLLHVCVKGGTTQMAAQALSGTVSVDYKLPTQRVNPAPESFTLASLKTNGSDLVFQNVNPAGNSTAQSFIRMTNNNATACPVIIDAKDDAGKHSGEVKFTLGAHESRQLNSEHLEGNLAAAGVTGSLGNGTGKWYIRIQAECSNFKASALNRHQDGVVTNLTPEKDSEGTIAEWLTPAAKL